MNIFIQLLVVLFSKKFRPNICKYFFILEKKLKNPKNRPFRTFSILVTILPLNTFRWKNRVFEPRPPFQKVETIMNVRCEAAFSLVFHPEKTNNYVRLIHLINNYPDLPWNFLKVRIIDKKVWRKFKISLKLSKFFPAQSFPSHEQEKCLDLTKRSQILK